MTSAGLCGTVRQALGVYVVGAIGPADRDAVDSHLASCAGCRDELSGLAGLPALLGRVPADEAAAILLGHSDKCMSQPALQSLLSRAARLRQHRLWPRMAAVAAAGLIVGAGVTAVSGIVDHPQAQPSAAVARQWSAMVRADNQVTHASATVKYLSRPWGLELSVQVSGIPTGTRCELQVRNTRGQEVASGSWTIASGHQDAWYSASSSVPLSAASSFVIMTGAQTLVEVPIR